MIRDIHIINAWKVRRNSYRKKLKDLEDNLIRKALMDSFGNISIASKLLKMNRGTLSRKIKEYGFDLNLFKV